MKTLIKILLLVVLSSCSARIGGVVDTAIEEGRALKDTEARAVIADTCLIGIGAWARLVNSNQQMGALMLCGGQVEGLRSVRIGGASFEPGVPATPPQLPQPADPTQ